MDPPDILIAKDIARIPTNDIESNVQLPEAPNARSESHPYFTARLAVRMETPGVAATSARLLCQVFTRPLYRAPPDDDFRVYGPVTVEYQLPNSRLSPAMASSGTKV